MTQQPPTAPRDGLRHTLSEIETKAMDAAQESPARQREALRLIAAWATDELRKWTPEAAPPAAEALRLLLAMTSIADQYAKPLGPNRDLVNEARRFLAASPSPEPEPLDRVSTPSSRDWHEPGPACEPLIPHYHHRAAPRITWDHARLQSGEPQT